ncbi:MAG: hypothetical protein CVT59_07480 [Actinobacteria bacterium HGW-Actinobacteria-1]|nr:MAG: hypothetical protein CVT59_07480 [Actinobacteria bacterium HGW-Actinobacteria-1]
MPEWEKTRVGSFMLSLVFIAAGLAVSLVAVLDVQSTSLVLVVAFAVAYGLVDAMSVRLARGDTVFVDGAVSLSAVVALSPGAAVLSCLVGTILGAVFHFGVHRSLALRLGEILKRPLLVAGLAVAAARFLDRGALAAGSIQALVVCVSLGLAYSAVDFMLLSAMVALDTKATVSRVVRGLARSLVALHAAHVSLGVAAALLMRQVGTWGLWSMVALVLLSQYSFNLLLRTRGAYSETIQALMRASELRVEDAAQGHSQRVADLAVGAGRLLGMSSATLEQLNYAALLHEIGRIGAGDDLSVSGVIREHALRGAEIVSAIPFLASTERMIANQRELQAKSPDSDEDLVCARLIGACCDLDRAVTAQPSRWTRAASAEKLDACLPETLETRLRLAVLQSAAHRIDQ